MKQILVKLNFCLALIALPLLVMAEDYTVEPESLALEAYVVGEHKVQLNWSGLVPKNNESLVSYALFRSFTDKNLNNLTQLPYLWFNGWGDTAATDNKAWRSAYYQVCAYTSINRVYCSPVVLASVYNDYPNCDYYTENGACTEKDESYLAIKTRNWSGVIDDKKNYVIQQKSQAQNSKHVEYQTWLAEQQALKERIEFRANYTSEVTVNTQINRRLDAWVLKIEDKMLSSNLPLVEKNEKIEVIKSRLQTWFSKGGKHEYVARYLYEKLNNLQQVLQAEEDVLFPLSDLLQDL